MPSDRNTAYPFLEQMRTEELEALLQQEFTAADGGEPDVDYIMAIMEVMEAAGCESPGGGGRRGRRMAGFQGKLSRTGFCL